VEWSNQAACLTAEPEVFFPIGSSGGALDEVTAAKAICAACGVLSECRDYALRTRQPFGVWGGLDEEQRRAVWAGQGMPALVR
jgi:WhiB family transcriptional regulator, redox-sensing transcriptional regulator